MSRVVCAYKTIHITMTCVCLIETTSLLVLFHCIPLRIYKCPKTSSLVHINDFIRRETVSLNSQPVFNVFNFYKKGLFLENNGSRLYYTAAAHQCG